MKTFALIILLELAACAQAPVRYQPPEIKFCVPPVEPEEIGYSDDPLHSSRYPGAWQYDPVEL